MSHTPGPWVYRDNGYFFEFGPEGSHHHIGDLCATRVNEIFNSQDESNARLVAAAPDLLEVVRAMAGFDGRNNNHHLKEMAKEALRKAVGE